MEDSIHPGVFWRSPGRSLQPKDRSEAERYTGVGPWRPGEGWFQVLLRGQCFGGAEREDGKMERWMPGGCVRWKHGGVSDCFRLHRHQCRHNIYNILLDSTHIGLLITFWLGLWIRVMVRVRGRVRVRVTLTILLISSS